MALVLVGILMGLLFTLSFILGGLYTSKILHEEEAKLEQNELKRRYYDLACVKRAGDPLPYVPPVQKTSRRLPHLDILNRRLKNGGRGTVILRAGR